MKQYLVIEWSGGGKIYNVHIVQAKDSKDAKRKIGKTNNLMSAMKTSSFKHPWSWL
jgi:hypothetical protein